MLLRLLVLVHLHLTAALFLGLRLALFCCSNTLYPRAPAEALRYEGTYDPRMALFDAKDEKDWLGCPTERADRLLLSIMAMASSLPPYLLLGLLIYL